MVFNVGYLLGLFWVFLKISECVIVRNYELISLGCCLSIVFKKKKNFLCDCNCSLCWGLFYKYFYGYGCGFIVSFCLFLFD